MSTEQMRAALFNKYPGSKKVAQMSDAQIHMVYTRLLNTNRL